MSLDPQNPYRSCVVRASAGSGKTYQLSRRFLFLVGSGAHPASILTVTFTKKAAGEMRERILDTAAQLLSSPEEQAAFDQKLQVFYQETLHHLHRPRPPRSALATAEAVLSSTQSLRIATIDAVLLEWMKKFPYEASQQGSLTIPAPFELMNQREEELLHRRAWYRTVEALRDKPQLKEQWQTLKASGLDLLEVESRIRELSRHESFLWLLEKQREHEASSPLLRHPLPDDQWDDSAEGFLRSVQEALTSVCQILAPPKLAEVRQALAALDMATLIELRILTKKWEIHGNTFRKPKRDPYEELIAEINQRARLLRSYRSRLQLNTLGSFLLDLYKIYEEQQNLWKLDLGRLTFSDLIKGGYHLFKRPEAAGVRYLLHRTIRHLLLDEFQDTSILQWTMFSSMAHEMLAGEGLRGSDEVHASLFIVGDPKQSIYGFREAEAEVLQHAAHFMVSRQALDISLSASYRTAPSLLAYINTVFQDKLPHFPEHEAARGAHGTPVIPGRASLTIGPLFLEEQHATPIDAEAKFVADTLQSILSDPATPALWDKESKTYRKLEARDCAILYRAATHASIYAEALRSVGLAARMEEGRSFFERLEVRDVLAFCRWMANPAHTEAFHQCLKSPLFRIADQDILTALYHSHENSRYERHLKVLDLLSERYPDSIQLLRTLLKERNRLRPQALLAKAALRGCWSQAYVEGFGQEEGVLAAANLARFLETIIDLEAQGFHDWIPLCTRLEELAAEQAVSLASVSENAVQLMTIHKAKGLEFPLVVLVGTGEEWEKSDPYWAKIKESPVGSGIAYVGRKSDRTEDDPHFEGLDAILHREAHQENLRLLYVALTRAQYHLLITGYQRKKYGAGFYQHLATCAQMQGAQLKDSGPHPILTRMDAGEPEALSHSSETSAAPAKQFLTDSELRDWLPRPTALPAVRILAPARLLNDSEEAAAKSSSAHRYATEIGTFVHRGLEASVKEEPFLAHEVWMGLGPHHPPSTYLDSYVYAFEKLQMILTSSVFQNLLSSALKREAEVPIAFLQGDQLVRGTIDLLLQMSPNSWLVVDYKTSEEAAEADDLEALARTKRYDQQLALYMQGVQLLYPDATVEGAIFFTSCVQMLRLAAPVKLC
jgi:ATP-dependent helicase/nuclease subunit A